MGCGCLNATGYICVNWNLSCQCINRCYAYMLNVLYINIHTHRNGRSYVADPTFFSV